MNRAFQGAEFLTVVTNSEAETEAWAYQFAQQLQPATTVALFGDLGAGKTVVCRGIARGRGFAGDVHSPSYAIVHEYAGPIPIFHMDLYRLKSGADWEEIGLDHYFNQGGICLIEWPERLPKDQKFSYKILLEANGKNGRKIQLSQG